MENMEMVVANISGTHPVFEKWWSEYTSNKIGLDEVDRETAFEAWMEARRIYGKTS